MRFDIGVFVDTGHLLAVEPTARAPGSLIPRIDAAAKFYCLSGAISHRVVLADCSDPSARALAEDFALKEGFRIRHVPPSTPNSHPQILNAEVLEATETSKDLLVIVVVGAACAYSTLADPLHRTGRALIAFTTDTAAPQGATDAVLQLPLDPSGLRELLRAAAATLIADGVHHTPAERLLAALPRIRTDFRPDQYGYRKGRDLLKAMDGSGYTLDRTARSVVLHPGDPGAAANSPARLNDPLPAAHALATQACRSLPAVHSTATDSLVAGMLAVLGALATEPELRRQAQTEGLTIQTVRTAFVTTCPTYSNNKSATKMLPLCLQAAVGTEWIVAADEAKPEHIRLFLGTAPPPFRQAH